MYWFICDYDNCTKILSTNDLIRVDIDVQNKKYILVFSSNVTITINAKSSDKDSILKEAYCFIRQLQFKSIEALKLGTIFTLNTNSVQEIQASCTS